MKRKGDDKSITDLKKDFIDWMQAHRIKEKRLETGFALTKYSTIIFAIHLLFETYYEPPMFMGNGTLVFGLGTTIVTFFSVILLPVFLFIVKTPFIETLHDFIPLWLLAISSSIGNILLISAYFARNRLKRKDFQKKYLLFTIICTICAFFPPRLEISYHSTFLFGYTLWLTAFFTLFIGLLLIYKNSDE